MHNNNNNDNKELKMMLQQIKNELSVRQLFFNLPDTTGQIYNLFIRNQTFPTCLTNYQ